MLVKVIEGAADDPEDFSAFDRGQHVQNLSCVSNHRGIDSRFPFFLGKPCSNEDKLRGRFQWSQSSLEGLLGKSKNGGKQFFVDACANDSEELSSEICVLGEERMQCKANV